MPAQRIFSVLDHRKKSYLAELAIGRAGVLRDPAHGFDSAGAGGERGAQVWLSDFVVERNHAVIARRAEPFLAIGGETQKLHAPISLFGVAENILRTAQSICVTLVSRFRSS